MLFALVFGLVLRLRGYLQREFMHFYSALGLDGGGVVSREIGVPQC